MPITNKNVFVVDDNESVCRALKCLLMTFGFEATTFLSAEEFFNAVPDSVQGCLIMDIHMNGLDGFEALKRIVKSGLKRRVIIISAESNGGLKERVLAMGGAGFFQKPVNGQDLVDLINNKQ